MENNEEREEGAREILRNADARYQKFLDKFVSHYDSLSEEESLKRLRDQTDDELVALEEFALQFEYYELCKLTHLVLKERGLRT